MNLSWSFTSKKNERIATLGQHYINATGYDDKHAAIYYKDNSNITSTSVKKIFEVTLGQMENANDYDGLCAALQISTTEMIKLLANKQSKLNEILKFIHQNVTLRTLVCSIYIINEEAELAYHSKSKIVTRPINKFFLGHHVIICIPLKSYLSNLSSISRVIMELLLKKDNGFPEFLLYEAPTLYDYTHVNQDAAHDTIKALIGHKFQTSMMSLFIELPASDKNYNFDSIAERSVMAIIWKLKMLIFLIEKKFIQQAESPNAVRNVTESERDALANHIIFTVQNLQRQHAGQLPPCEIYNLYFECQNYLEYYFSIFNATVSLTFHHIYLRESVETANQIVKSTPYSKHEDFWFIEINDENAKRIQEEYLQFKLAILVSPKTKYLAKEIYSDKITWLFSTETQWKEAVEPVLLFNVKKDYLIGLAEPINIYKQSDDQGKIFMDNCACGYKTNLKAWICTNCKTLLQYLNNKKIKCGCGVQNAETIIKTCFKCRFGGPDDLHKKKEFETENISKLPLTPSSPIKLSPLEGEKSEEIPLPALSEPEKKKDKFNILFIGQSGAGKSMLVNSINNYLTYDFDAVAKAEAVNCILPCQFQLQTADYKKVEFRAGPANDNEFFNDNGESVTQKPKIYSFETEKYECSILDTPGLGDTRGAKQDQHNLNLIRETISTLDNLNAICFVIPPNISKLTANFEMIMRDLLSLFPKTALKNVFFVFTHANSSFFTIGDTRSSLDQFIRTFKKTNNAEIPFHQNNVCCVDSEAFMYFIATKQGHQYQNRNEESFRLSWDKSKEAIVKLLKNLKNIDPVNTKDISMIRELEDIGNLLKDETESKLESLICGILTRISEISMTSDFNSNKNLNNKSIEASMISELFKGLHLCKSHVGNQVLKKMIEKFIEIYGQPYMSEIMEQLKVAPQPNNTEKQQIYQNGKSAYPIKAVEKEEKRICINCLKVLVNLLSNEWNEDYLPRELMEDILNVQCVISIKPENVKKEKLITSLKRIKKAVKAFETDVSQVLKCKNFEHEFLKID